MNLAQIQGADKSDLVDELTRLKKRERDLKAENARKANKLMGSVLTIGAGVGAGYFMASKEAEVEKQTFDSEEAKKKALADATQVMGIDIDALVGIAAFGLGLTDAADGYSETLLAIGSGALAVAGGRMFAAKAKEADKKEGA